MLYVNPQTATSLAGLDRAPGSKHRETEVLKEYEQLFIYQMIKEMRKTVPDVGLVDGPQRAHFDEMMDDFLAGEMAKSGQFGIAKQMAEQIALQKASAVPSEESQPGGLPVRPVSDGLEVNKGASRPGVPIRKNLDEGISLRPVRGLLARYAASSAALDTGIER